MNQYMCSFGVFFNEIGDDDDHHHDDVILQVISFHIGHKLLGQ